MREADYKAVLATMTTDLDNVRTTRRLEAELKRWRDGTLVCRQVIDVETGTTTTKAIEARASVVETTPGPPRKTPRREPRSSLLSQLVQVKTEKVQKLQEDLENSTMCTLCWTNPRNIYFQGCGHCLACGTCADKLIAQHGGTVNRTSAPCPVCRQPIRRILAMKLA